MGKSANDERDFRKEITKLRKRVASVEKQYRRLVNRISDLEEIGLELEFESIMQELEIVEEKLPEEEDTGLTLLQKIKKERLKQIQVDI
jgi:hypothetical protein